MIRKLLKGLLIIQVINNKKRKEAGLPVLGHGNFEAYRLNPWNPLSYVTLIIIIIVGLIMFGIVGFWKEVDMKNPFKWS